MGVNFLRMREYFFGSDTRDFYQRTQQTIGEIVEDDSTLDSIRETIDDFKNRVVTLKRGPAILDALSFGMFVGELFLVTRI